MQTSLARRERRRRNGNGSHSAGGGPGRRLAIAFPLFLLGSLVFLGLVGMVAVVAAFSYYSQGLPDPKQQLDNLTFNQETVITDRTGKVELARFGLEQRKVVTFDQIPPVVIDATTSVEDHTFWDNAGFDPVGIVKAGLDTLHGSARGASTITQQLVRARLLPDSVLAGSTYERKIKEIIQSIRLTQEYPGREGKQAIITTYLNQNYYGNQSYGIAAAARGYFGIDDLSKMTLAQAAILAAIPQSPSTYDLVKNAVKQPDGKLVVPDDSAIVARRNLVLDLMQRYAVLTTNEFSAADYAAARAEAVVLSPQTQQNWKAPHFVWQVRHQLGEILCGPAAADQCEKVDTGGYTVTTTLDWTMQQSAERWLKAAAIAPNQSSLAATQTYLRNLGVGTPSWAVRLRGLNIHNAAMGAIDYRTGQVYAYAGSAGYYEPSTSPKFQPQFDVFGDGWRQPGSAFKPINYVTALDDRTLTAASLLMDVATDFGGGYVPMDADKIERGPLRVREALEFSLNIPAIKTALINGVDHLYARAQDFGLTFQLPSSQAGASIGIGTLEVHPVDLLSAYGAIADGGVLMPRTTILSIADSNGNKIWPTAAASGKQVVSAQAAYVMTSILAGNTDPATNAIWAHWRLTDGGKRRPATLKTGTNDNAKDLTAGGWVAPPADPNAPALAAVAWAGNSDNTAPAPVFSIDVAAPMWQGFMLDATKGTPIVDFPRPSGIVQTTIDAYSGMLPGPFTTKTINEVFIEGTQPTQVDSTKIPVDVDTASGKLWADGCAGPKVTNGYLDLSKVESGYSPQWQKYDQAWIARARRGAGVGGGPGGGVTGFLFEPGYYPFGATYGAPFAPTDTCTPAPSASPSCDPSLASCPPVPSCDPTQGPCPSPTLPPSLPPGGTPTPKPSHKPGPVPSASVAPPPLLPTG
ncbi:MAG TPA: transglycosylase domain-containing protein [Candidatus Limnocylindrales bacterium]